MAKLKTQEEISHMHRAGKIVAACHQEIGKRIRPGVTTLHIDAFVEEFMRRHGAVPAQKGYKGFPFATCASVNDVACHGFPSTQPLQDGDVVTIDMVANVNGWLADSAWTYGIGRIDASTQALMQTAQLALYRGIAKARAGYRIGDIGHEIESFVQRKGFKVIPDFIGHGIGTKIHEKPDVYHTGKAGTGVLLEAGMVITVEPIIGAGGDDVWTDSDGWTVRTWDSSRTAQYEHTIAITDGDPLLLTQQI
ncbi:type I methionyl aminopeptidase [Paenibacillus sp. GCM10012307]|uniref:Methionine aminopeptidase n=1 Tax=Paenibacillus roseus TaxID=2798579 RepID=A0A934J9E3_9BACL|nr:type I methionyl aminopeptidase [Paenibacillus roseus]MBJ6362857.1 type I methionyl aminopeptidase [Paenibacillus roseus]